MTSYWLLYYINVLNLTSLVFSNGYVIVVFLELWNHESHSKFSKMLAGSSIIEVEIRPTY